MAAVPHDAIRLHNSILNRVRISSLNSLEAGAMDSMLYLRDKVAVVTGGNRNIGYVLSRGLAQAGARVLIANRDAVSGESAAERLRMEGYEVGARQTDVSSLGSCHEMARFALDHWGRVDILINNAAVVVNKMAVEHTSEDFELIMNINVRGVLNCCQSVYPSMRARKAGRVINIGSLSADRGVWKRTLYAASKAAVIALTRGLALEWARDGITVNAVSPGTVVAAGQTKTDTPAYNANLDMIPLARFARPEDLVGVCVFLASDASSYVTGQNILIDGGWSLSIRPRVPSD